MNVQRLISVCSVRLPLSVSSVYSASDLHFEWLIEIGVTSVPYIHGIQHSARKRAIEGGTGCAARRRRIETLSNERFCSCSRFGPISLRVGSEPILFVTRLSYSRTNGCCAPSSGGGGGGVCPANKSETWAKEARLNPRAARDLCNLSFSRDSYD